MAPSLGSQTLVHGWPHSGHSPSACPVPLPTVPALAQSFSGPLQLDAPNMGAHNHPLGTPHSGCTPVYNCQISPFQAECSVSATIKCFCNCPISSSPWSFFFFSPEGLSKLLIRDSVFLLLASSCQLRKTTHWNWGITASGLQDAP